MKARERMKLERASSRSEGSIWELCLFVIFFVVVFSVIARADETTVSTASGRSGVVSKTPAKAAKRAGKSTVAQTEPTLVAQNEQPAQPEAQGTGNPAIEKPIRAKAQQIAPVPTGALPVGTVGATLAEPKLNGPRFTPRGRLLVETTGTVSSEEARSFGGWYQLAFGVADSQTNMAVGVLAGYSREYSYQRDDNSDGDFDNPIISLNKKWKNGVHFKSAFFDQITLGLSGAVGVSREARRRTFMGSVGPTFAVAKEISKLSIGMGVGYNRGFYEYDIRDDGTVNSPDQFLLTPSLSYAITDKLSASASMLYTYGISFQGVGRANELSALSVYYAFSKKFTVSAGVATQRGTLEADGYTNTIKIFDPNVAQAFLDLNFIL